MKYGRHTAEHAVPGYRSVRREPAVRAAERAIPAATAVAYAAAGIISAAAESGVTADGECIR